MHATPSNTIQHRNPNRGRPRKTIPPRVPLVHGVAEWSFNTNESNATTKRRIKRGEIRVMPNAGAGKPLKIPTTEYVRLGYVQSLDELL
jgi:hypothetical protein